MTAPGLAEQILEAAIAASVGADADEVLANMLRQRLSAIAQTSNDFLSEMLGVPAELGADCALIIQFLDSQTPRHVGINAATREAVREIVLEGIGRGRPFIQMANEIEPMVGLTENIPATMVPLAVAGAGGEEV